MIRYLICCALSLSWAFAGTVKVGVTAGPHAQIMEKVAEIAKKQNVDVKVIEFNDFVLPNQALDQGDLDMNSFQHKPYLETQVQDRGLKLMDLGQTVLMPLRAYAKKIKSLSELCEGATVVIPNDPTNEARSLKLLAAHKLIVLKDVKAPTVQDVQENPKKLVIKEVEAPLIPRMLDDADLCVVNTDWVLVAKMDPESALLTEEIQGNPYVNVLAIRAQDNAREDLKKIMEIYHSEPIKTFINESFKKAVIPSW